MEADDSRKNRQKNDLNDDVALWSLALLCEGKHKLAFWAFFIKMAIFYGILTTNFKKSGMLADYLYSLRWEAELFLTIAWISYTNE